MIQVFFVCLTRFAEMDLIVDYARNQNQSGPVDNFIGLSLSCAIHVADDRAVQQNRRIALPQTSDQCHISNQSAHVALSKCAGKCVFGYIKARTMGKRETFNTPYRFILWRAGRECRLSK